MLIRNLKKLIGIDGFSREEYGYLCLYLVTFVPLIYKFISPFFIILGLANLTILINPIILICGLKILNYELRKNIRSSDIILYSFVCALLLLTTYLFPTNTTLFEHHYANFVFFTLSFYFIGLTINYSKHYRVISAVAKIGFWYNIYWQALIYWGIVETEHSYDDTAGEQMAQAYFLLFSSLVLFIDVFRKSRFTDFVYLVVSILLLLFMGTRGPVMILAVFIITYLILFHKFKSYNIQKKTLVVACLFVVIYFLEIILMGIIPIASALGFSTRVFDSVLDGRMTDMSESSGRDEFWNILKGAIEHDYGGIGYGWLGDRLLLPDGAYAHNFELEILVQFGIIIGGGILLLMLFLILKSYYKIKNTSSRAFWLVMLFVGLVTLQISATYVTHPLLFVMIGYFISINRSLSK